MAVIQVEHEAIRYITGDFKDIGLKEYVLRRIQGQYHVTEFWANDDITFSLEEGDMLGIVGINGAGKSTLLKAISGVMEPTRGNIRVKGRIAALLELTAGFDKDLTVRENTYLRGALMGYTRQFMDEMYDRIIEFAELQSFQERPLRQLSSGMRSRLAFSIACLVNPDILILDEVLSVGDGAFRKKSGAKMREILNSGVTGILVSHSMSQIRELCNKILWLDHGKQIAFGAQAAMLCNAYEEYLITRELPNGESELQAMAKQFEARCEAERKQAEKEEILRLQQLLESGDSDAAVEAALNVIRKSRPQLLR